MAESELEEAMSYLSKHTLELPQHIGDVSGGAAEYVEAVKALTQSLADKRQQAEELLGSLKEALETLKKQADDADDTLEATTKAAESALQEAVAALDAGERGVLQAIEDATAKLDRLKDTAAKGGDRAEEAQSQGEGALDELTESLGDGASKVESALGPAIALAGKLAEAVESTQEAIKQPVDTVTAQIAALGPDAESHVTDVGTRIFELMGSLPDRYEGPVSELEAMAEALAAEFKEIAEDGGEELKQLADPIDQARNVLQNTLAEPPEAWKEARETIESETGALEKNQQPLTEAVAAVRVAADHHGREFGT